MLQPYELINPTVEKFFRWLNSQPHSLSYSMKSREAVYLFSIIQKGRDFILVKCLMVINGGILSAVFYFGRPAASD
jgi:hypothetical protein